MNNTTNQFARLKRYPSILIVVLLCAGCEQGNEPEPLPGAPNERLAYAIAAALGNPDVRESVHQAMDASPYVEHKLVLQEFLETPAGSDLQGALSHELGGEQMLTDLLAELPTLDFYLPYETHRKTWEHANSNLWAVCEVDPDAGEGMAYHPDGSHEWLTSKQEVLEAKIAAMFVLHRAEAKILRNPAASARLPNVQADKDDWKTGISKIENYTEDGGMFGGNCEFYFETNGGIYVSEEVSVNNYIIRDGGTTNIIVPGKLNLSPALPVNPEAASNSHHIFVKMMEDDGFLNGDDDYYGTFEVTGAGIYNTKMTTDFGDDGVFPSAKVTIVVD